MMKRFNKAFTLTELLVALGVIAVLCAVLMPIIFNSMPNQNIMMAKRAFYATQTVVMDLPNGEQLVKIVSWYDNEYSYTCQYVRIANKLAGLVK